MELQAELTEHGFEVSLYGDTPVGSSSGRQKVLRPLKALAARLGLIPKSMKAKKLLKRLVFGRLVPMPAEISSRTAPMVSPLQLDPAKPDSDFKVILCAATLT